MKHPKLHRCCVAVLPWLAAWLIRCWFFTCRRHEHGTEYKQQALDTGKPVVAVFWHYSLVYLFFHVRNYAATALVSASADGDYIARLAEQFSFTAVRGSSNRRGMRALKELLAAVKAGSNLALVADGSQGPALKVQKGSLILAAKSGSPILPIVWSASRYHVFRSWDRLAVPKLFSRVDLYFGEPLLVPEGIDGDDLERYRELLEKRMLALYRDAWSRYGKEGH